MTDSPPRSSRLRRLFTWQALLLGVVWAISLAVAGRATLFYVEKETPILRRLGLLPLSGLYQTNLHAVSWERVPIFEDGRYGAIAPLAGGVLYSTRSGRLFFADSTRTVRELALRVPINVVEFDSDTFNATTVNKDHFAVKDLHTELTPAGVRIFASHHQWDPVDKCDWLRVSVTELNVDGLLGGGSAEWSTLYDTRPCMPLGDVGGGAHTPTIGAGGRLARLNDEELLLTVGSWTSDVEALDDPSVYVDPSTDRDYGRTLALDVSTGAKRTFTRGHRNPQGLAITPDGRVWETEHAAKGGDELNLLEDGGDYGYPFASYGTMYGLMDWPLDEEAGKHEGYDKPAFSWVPSIGSSQLIHYSGALFEGWKDDLIVASLAARSLFRVRVEGGVVKYVEPLVTGHRTRDIVEIDNGEIVFLAEDRFLVYLRPISFDGDDPTLMSREMGQVVASRCLGCHSFERGAPATIGPSLHGVVNRRIASMRGFTYSDALEARDGRWTEQNLRDFLSNPRGFAPGTSMEFPFELTEREIDNLLTYLRSLD